MFCEKENLVQNRFYRHRFYHLVGTPFCSGIVGHAPATLRKAKSYSKLEQPYEVNDMESNHISGYRGSRFA